jgi:hypothetical protein
MFRFDNTITRADFVVPFRNDHVEIDAVEARVGNFSDVNITGTTNVADLNITGSTTGLPAGLPVVPDNSETYHVWRQIGPTTVAPNSTTAIGSVALSEGAWLFDVIATGTETGATATDSCQIQMVISVIAEAGTVTSSNVVNNTIELGHFSLAPGTTLSLTDGGSLVMNITINTTIGPIIFPSSWVAYIRGVRSTI